MSLTQKTNHFVPLISHKSNRAMKKRKIDNSIPSLQLLFKVLKNKEGDSFLSLKISIKIIYNTVLQGNSSNKGQQCIQAL